MKVMARIIEAILAFLRPEFGRDRVQLEGPHHQNSVLVISLS